MKRIIFILCATLIATLTYAQLEVINANSDNIDQGSYLNSWVPDYCKAAVAVSSNYLTVSTNPVNTGSSYSVLLSYSGSWESYFLLNKNWTPIDISVYDHIKVVLYTATDLTGSSIPSILLAYQDGTTNLAWDSNKDGRKQKSLADYIPVIPPARAAIIKGGVWTTIEIPIRDLGSHLSTNQGIGLCSTVWGPGNPGTVYLDKITLTSTNPTATPLVLAQKSDKPYYANGMIHLNGYKGSLNVINVFGKSVFSSTKASGNVPVNLPEGVYLIKTEKNVTKITVE